MKGNTLNKYDAVLTPDERFRLALAALARDDDAEVRRLVTTCPRHTYTMADTAFWEQWRASDDVAKTFGVLWLWTLHRYTEAHLLRATHERAVREGMTTLAANDVADMLIRRGEELRGTYVGLLRFCKAVRLTLEELFAWWPPVFDTIAGVREVTEGDTFETDEAVAAQTYRVLALRWPALRDTVSDDEDEAEGGEA